jgi:hypothetical protein
LGDIFKNASGHPACHATVTEIEKRAGKLVFFVPFHPFKKFVCVATF